MLIVGAGGQLGSALRHLAPAACPADLPELDLTDRRSVEGFDFGSHDTIINAAAFTAVDAAEEQTGRRQAWEVNVHGVQHLVGAAARRGITLVHVSTDYVFDGAREVHDESETFSPLGVYGQTKAAADAIVATLAQHYVVRTSWVVGNGRNFVRTMAELAGRGVDPTVIDDQVGRLTFTDDLARGILHLVRTGSPYGTYNLTSSGEACSWYEIACVVFELLGHSSSRVTPVSTSEYASGRSLAPRPRHSSLDISKIRSTGFEPRAWRPALESYLAELQA